MAQSEELKLHISATDGTEAALKSITHNFKREQAEIQRGVRRLSDGTRVWVEDIQKAADKQGVSLKAMMAHLNSTQAAANRAGQGVGGTGGAFSRLTSVLGPAGAALAATAGRFLSVAAAAESARRGIVGYAEFDTQLRLTQNQTGMLTSEVKGLSSELKTLEIRTATSKEELLKMYNELREAGRFTPEQMKKIFPDVALALKGMGGDAVQASAALGHVFRNMSIPAEQFVTVLDSASYASKELQLDWGKMAPQMARVSEAAAAAGYKGSEGFQRIATMLGIVNEAFGDPARSATVLTSMLEKASSFEGVGRKLGFKSSKEYADWYKQQKDGLGSVLDLISQLENQDEIMEHFGVREAGAWRKLLSTKDEFIPKLRAMQAAQGGAAAAGKNMADSLESSYTRLGKSLSQLTETLGALLDAIYIPQVFTKFAEVLGTMADSMMKLIEGAKFLLGLGEWPTWMPKSWGEASFNMQVGKTREGKRVMEYDEYLAGGDPAKAKREYDEKMEREDKAIEAAKQKRTEDKERERREELRAKGYKNVPREPEPGTTPAPGPLWQFRPPGSQSSLPPKLTETIQKVSDAIDVSNKALIELASQHDERQGVLMKAGLYNLGAGPAGTGTPTATSATPTAAPYGPPGTGYGSSTDARFLRASYSPSGAVYGGGGGTTGPGGTGTGYGGGTTLAPPPGAGAPQPPSPPGGRFNQPAPTAPPAPRRRGGPNAPPEGPAAPPSGSLAEDRQKFKAELDADPALKDIAIDAMKHEGGLTSNLEQLFNYASMRGMTIKQALYSGQYGPMTGRNRNPNMGKNVSPKLRAEGEAALAKVYGGSNITDYATDQGMQGDPNFAKYQANKEYWNTKKVEGAWFSAHGERGRKWAAAQRERDKTQTAALPPTAPPAPGAPAAPPAPGAPAAPPAPGAPAAPPAPGDTSGDTLYPRNPDGSLHRTEAGMNPELRSRLLQMKKDSPYGGAGLQGPRSGHRTYQEQVDIFRTSRPGYAARPGRSRHGHGAAADLKYMSPEERAWYHANAARYGIKFPMGHEPWHAEQDPRYAGPAFNRPPTATAAAPSVGSGGRETGRQSREYDTSVEGNYDAIQKQLRENPQFGYSETETVPGIDVTSGSRGPHPLPPSGHVEREMNKPFGTDPDKGEGRPRDREVRLDLKVNDTQVQFARASMRRQADREVREARWNSYSDIGAA